MMRRMPRNETSAPVATRARRRWFAAAAASVLGVGVIGLPSPASASTVSSAAFSGGAGTASVGGALYARSGAALTLTVTTSIDTRCVDVSGAFSGHQVSSAEKSAWTFSVPVGAGDGVKTVTVVASPAVNPQDKCTGNSGSAQASFVLDNTGPVVSGVVSPAPNAAGWNNSSVSITWSASDAGSGVGSGPAPAADSVTANGTGETKTATATDRVGNSGSGSVTVKLDKAAPTISGSRNPAANAHGWNNSDVTVSFTCADFPSGIKSCTGPTTLSTSASGQSVTGTAVDNADNSAAATVSNINIDKVSPTLTGAPTSGPGGAGWYRDDVTIGWTANDALSGVAATPATSTITGEGSALTATASVTDKAGNVTTATSPAVKIDRTAPTTTATAPTAWNNTDVTVSLDAADALSGVGATRFTVDGGAEQSGTSVPVSSEGVHDVQFWSVDKAGNAEAPKTVKVKIDKTPPTITHAQAPVANASGWNNEAVTVTFVCDDSAGSGIASCTTPRTISTEGKDQAVTGTATDSAGNTATDPATVNIDLTKPTITGSAAPAANANGWRNSEVTVTFSCDDPLSGIDTCTGPKSAGEGAGQSVTGTATDAAGNTSSATVENLDVDLTDPTITGAVSGPAGGGGWYTGDVTVSWTCEDALSGIEGSCPAPSTVTGEGEDGSASVSLADKAGNTAAATKSGIKIDRTPPSTSADVTGPTANGWYTAAPTVTLTSVDPLSGPDHISYAIDEDAWQTYTAPFTVSAGGKHVVRYVATDVAGNTETAGTGVEVWVDTIDPTVTADRFPAANAFGWNNTAVTVSAQCDDRESGIAACSADPSLIDQEGAGQSAVATAVDFAGNVATATVEPIDLDLTKPRLVGAPTAADDAAGWYRGDVTIHWAGQDGLSGIDPATQPADSVITGEGADLGAGPVTIADKAGNVSDPASVTGIKIDRTPPVIKGAPRTAPNAAGWYGSVVVVGFDCTDNLSGVAGCPSDIPVTGDGANKSVTSGSATDNAGNVASGITVGGLNLDGTPPQTTIDNQCTASNGWCTGSTATVVLTATDQATLSGVKEIHYTIGSGTEQVVTGGTATATVTLSGAGTASISYYAVDKADNVEPKNTATLNYDNIAPTVSHTLSPAPNADEWNKAPVTVTFSATDTDSGVDLTSVTAPVTVSTETAGQTITGTARDKAGNTGTDTVKVKLDKTGPSVTPAVAGTKGNNGWYTSAVTVSFACTDTLSGVATCPDPVKLLSDGAGQKASGTATDRADNTTTATAGGIDIDSTAPVIASTTVAHGAVYTLGDVPAPACSATDATSGVASCTVDVTTPTSGVGTVTFNATATDKAGNSTTTGGSYTVRYRFDGFLQPINDTAHQIGTSVSVFKAGSTIPVKLQLKRADGSVVQGGAPQITLPAKGSLMVLGVNENAYGDTATTGDAFKWDSTSQQWIYTLSTKGLSAGYFYRVGAKLSDGSTQYVNIGLK